MFPTPFIQSLSRTYSTAGAYQASLFTSVKGDAAPAGRAHPSRSSTPSSRLTTRFKAFFFIRFLPPLQTGSFHPRGNRASPCPFTYKNTIKSPLVAHGFKYFLEKIHRFFVVFAGLACQRKEPPEAPLFNALAGLTFPANCTTLIPANNPFRKRDIQWNIKR